MEDKIIELIRDKQQLPLTAFKLNLPEIVGENDFYLSTKGIEHTNLLLISGVSEIFIASIHEMVSNGVLTFTPCNFWDITAESGEYYSSLPIAKNNQLEYQTPHWLPIMIKKGENFPT